MKRLVGIETAAFRAALKAAGLVALLGYAATSGAEELWDPPSSNAQQKSQGDTSSTSSTPAQSSQPAPSGDATPQSQDNPDQGATPDRSAGPADDSSGAAPTTENGQPTAAIPVQPQPEAAPAAREATRLDTIEVTSQKRVKAQRDIPGSVGAIRGDELEKMKAQDLSDYLKVVPGVTLTDYGDGQSVAVIRGIASNTGSLGSQFTAGTTGLFVDDLPFADLFAPLSNPDLNPFDLERVEVLKGPQGTLFGSSALAGAIRYIVQKPQFSVWEGKVATTVEQTSDSDGFQKVGAGAVNVPLFGDSAALRVVGLYRTDPGYYDARPNYSNCPNAQPCNDPNVANLRNEHDINHLTQFTGRALGAWQVTDALKLNAMYFSQRTNQADQGSADNYTDPSRNDNPFPSPFEHTFSGGSLTANYDFDWAHVLYTGSTLKKTVYNEAHLENTTNATEAQQAQEWFLDLSGRNKGYTHEVRLVSPEGGDRHGLEWLVGAAYMNYKEHFLDYEPPPGPANQGVYANPPRDADQVPQADRDAAVLFATVDGDGTEKAVFGEATQRLGDHFEVTGGARYFRTRLVADTLLEGAEIVALTGGSQASANHYDTGEHGLNPKLALRYIHDSHIQLYALASKGFQFGGFQLNPPIVGIEQASQQQGFHFAPYKSSVLWNYEAGLRTEWLDHRLRVDITRFYLDWTNLQLTIGVPLNPQPIPDPLATITGVKNVTYGVIVNVAAAHSVGTELSFQVLPLPGVTYTSNATWITAVTDEPFDTQNSAGPVEPGTRLPGTPRFAWSNVLAYEYAVPFFPAWSGTFSATHFYMGTAPNSIRADSEVGGYSTVDLALAFVKNGSVWMPEVTLGVNNVTDARGVVSSNIPDSTITQIVFVKPRTTILGLAWRL